jgi:hypothetical protein
VKYDQPGLFPDERGAQTLLICNNNDPSSYERAYLCGAFSKVGFIAYPNKVQLLCQ